MRIKATIQVNGNPLRRAYVEHLSFGVGGRMYMTDTNGRIRDENFNEGVESAAPWADIRIICQNPVLRVIDGDKLNIGVYQDVNIRDGSVINLNANSEQDDYYAILNRAQLAYEAIFAPLDFFQALSDPEFPLGRSSTLRSTRDKAKRIELVYPDHSPSTLAWVEPTRLVDKFPLIHIKHRSSDGRLFGEAGQNPTLVPGELAHALHFSFLTESQRSRAQTAYLDFLLVDLANGGTATHSFTARTTAEVAYIEAADHFATRFSEFLRARQGGTSTRVLPVPLTETLLNEFVVGEWNRVTSVSLANLGSRVVNLQPPLGDLRAIGGGGTAVATQPRVNRFLRRPTVTGGDAEGAVYSAIFVDFADRVGFNFAASSYFAANALTFGEYRSFINNRHPEHAAELEAVRVFWGL